MAHRDVPTKPPHDSASLGHMVQAVLAACTTASPSMRTEGTPAHAGHEAMLVSLQPRVRERLLALMGEVHSLLAPEPGVGATGSAMHPDGDVPELPAELGALLADVESGDAELAASQWLSLAAATRQGRGDLAERVVRRLLRGGLNVRAHEVAADFLSMDPTALVLRHLEALALARSGAPRVSQQRAAQLQRELLAQPAIAHEHAALLVEVSTLLGRTYKDLAFEVPRSRRVPFLRQARDGYLAAYEHAPTGSRAFPAVNLAAMALLLGERGEAARWAGVAADDCKGAPPSPGDREARYWHLATLGEATLILGDPARAGAYLGDASRVAEGAWGWVATTRRQLLRLAPVLRVAPSRIRGWLPVPPVVVFAGHMLDRADRRVPRFPEGMERWASHRITSALESLAPLAGFSSAACGADLLFLEAMEARGAPTSVVLPVGRDDFVRESVAFGGGGWVTRFERALAHAGRTLGVEVLSGAPLAGDGLAFSFGNQVLFGLAALKARELDTDLVGIALWDERPGLAGGTAETVAHWQERAASGAMRVIVLSLAQLPPAGG